MLFKKNFFLEIVLARYARKTQNLHILRGKLEQNMIFRVHIFFKIVLFKNNFFFKIVLFKYNFFLKILLFENLFCFKIMLFEILFLFKIWRVPKILIQNLLLKSSFQILANLLSTRYQLPTCWIITMACGKKIFYECVACVSPTFGTIFIGYCDFHGNWVLDGFVNYIICTTIWFIQISLEFKKWLVYKDFFWKILNYCYKTMTIKKTIYSFY